MISLSSGVDPGVWLPQRWVKLRYLGVRLWSHCHRGWIGGFGCLKGESNYGTSVYDYDLIVIGGGSGGLAASKVSQTTAPRCTTMVSLSSGVDPGVWLPQRWVKLRYLGVRLWSHCHRGWIRGFGCLKGESNYGTSVYDYDLIVIGGGSGGLAASKVSQTTAPRCTTMVSLSLGVDPGVWLPQRWVKLRYLGVRLWSHCHRGWIGGFGCLKGRKKTFRLYINTLFRSFVSLFAVICN